MKIQPSQREGTTQRRTFVDPRPKRVSEMLDKDGNVIDPRTKQIIRKADQK